MTDVPDPTTTTGHQRYRTVVIGASGYVGGRLVGELVAAGHDVVCVARTPGNLSGLPWFGAVEVVRGDVLDAGSLLAPFAGADAVYHLVHAMGDADDFADADRRGAANVRDAAAEAGVGRIVYLGGLGPVEGLSSHLASRHEVGEVLAAGPVPVTELRAAIIIGSGSASFEMLRSLVEVLPVMVVPKWVHRTRCQPIAIRDVLFYLVAILDVPDTAGRVLDIGGPEVFTYQEMMQVYAREAGLPRRVILPVPVLTPWLSSHWINVVTPLPIGLAKPLVSSLTTDVVVRPDHDITRWVPHTTIGLAEAISRALLRIRDLDVVTSWAGVSRATARRVASGRPAGRAGSVVMANPAEPVSTDPGWSGGTLLRDERQAVTTAGPEDLYAVVSGIGGDRGWYGFNWMWRLRGLGDKLTGGVGMRRGRRHPDDLRVGDALDFWRVEMADRPNEVRLRAEMMLPGTGWLDWRIEPLDGGGCRLHQTALFAPRGLVGRLYWGALTPFHHLLFGRLAKAMAAAAEQRSFSAR
jgi:uncharacterized protein YbjT (DUF2867 family)